MYLKVCSEPRDSSARPPRSPPSPRPAPKYSAPKTASTVEVIVIGETSLTNANTAIMKSVVQKGFRTSRARHNSRKEKRVPF